MAESDNKGKQTEQEMKDLQGKVASAQAAAKEAQRELSKYERDLDRNIQKQLNAVLSLNAAQASGNREAAKRARGRINDLEAEISGVQGLIDLQDESVNKAKERLKVAESAQSKMEEQLATEKELQEQQKESNKHRAEGLRQIEKSLRMIPGVGGMLAHAFDRAADSIEAGGSSFDAMISLAKHLGQVLGPAALLKSIFDVNKELGVMHKELGVGFDSAMRIRKEFEEISNQADSSRINSIKLVKAQTDLSNQLGLVTQFSGESLKNYINTTEYLGASAEAAANLQIAAAATGQGVDKFTEGLAGAAQQSESLYGIHLPLRDVVEGISKMQGATLAYLVDQPKQLVKAVAMANKLGISFEKIRGIADGLNNFEQSITAELEAEVFLGRDINLNKARQLAFLGKEAELGAEILKQVGSLSDFQNMLPIQQESFAKALGMSRDELGKVLLRQEMISQFGDKASKLSAEQLTNAKAIAKEKNISLEAALIEVNSQVDATKKFEDAAKNIRAALQDIVVRFSPMIDKLANFVSNLSKSPLAKAATVLLAGAGVASAALSFFRNFGGVQRVFVVNGGSAATGRLGAFGQGFTDRLKGVPKSAAPSGLAGAGYRMGRVAGPAAIAGVVGLGISSLGSKAAERGKEGLASGLGAAGGAISGAAMGATIGSIIPVWGTAVGAAIGGLYGGITGYLDKQEAARDAKRAEIQKEIDERGAVADELKQIRTLLAESESGVYIDGDRVGTSLLKGASMPKASYEL